MTTLFSKDRLYFRARKNGATVFRMTQNDRDRRLDMIQIATIKAKAGTYALRDEIIATPEELSEIEAWIRQHRHLAADARRDDVDRIIEQINYTAQWAQAEAAEEELQRVADDLLLAIHDLRSVLVRRRQTSHPAAG